MFLVRLFNFIKGYVVIIIEGVFPERFLNICARRGIYLWNVKRQGKLSLSANISVKGFKMLPPIAKKSRCRVHIKKRRGIPFYIYKHRKRKAFLGGAVLFAVLLFVMTRFIWVINITGNESVANQKILDILEESGLKVGQLSAKINISDVQSAVLTKEEKISWIGIQVKGTTAYIEVKERTLKPDIFPKDKPCSIYARHSGVIESIEATNGHRLVSAGDVVKEGQLLISGALDSKVDEGVRFVHADGDVVARTWHEVTVPLPKYEDVRQHTGKTKSKHMLKIFSFYVRLFASDKVPFEDFDRVSDVKRLYIGKNTALPFSFHYDKYYEVKTTQIELDEEAAVAKAAEEAGKSVEGIQVLGIQSERLDDSMKFTFECLEDIAQKLEISREAVNVN